MTDATARAAPTPSSRLWDRAHFLLASAAFLWASNFVIAKSLIGSIPPVSLSFWRWVLALVLLAPLAWPHLRADWPAIRRGWPRILLLGTLGVAGSNTLAYHALVASNATSTILVQSAIPVAVLALGIMVFRERPTRWQLVAMGIALAGVLSIVLGKPGAHVALGGGMLLAVGAMLAQSLYVALLRLRPPLHPVSFLFTSFVAAAIVLLPFQVRWGTPPVTGQWPLAALGYLAVGPSILAFFLFNRGVALVGASRAALYLYLMPVAGTVLAVLFLGETIGVTDLAGFALVGLGFALTRRR